MSMFNTINYLLHDNRKSELDNVLLSNFSPFMTQRAFSYYGNGEYCDYINSTLNLYFNVFNTDEDQFKFFENVIPKLSYQKYEWLKKPKAEKIKKDSKPIPEFYSRRELDMLKDLNK